MKATEVKEEIDEIEAASANGNNEVALSRAVDLAEKFMLYTAETSGRLTHRARWITETLKKVRAKTELEKTEFKWEKIDNYTHRAKVFRGWLVTTREDVSHDTHNGMQSGWDFRISTVFVPDIYHQWKL